MYTFLSNVIENTDKIIIFEFLKEKHIQISVHTLDQKPNQENSIYS